MPVPSRSPLADSWLPLARWNLRYNPFGELTWDERATLAVFDPAPVVSELLNAGVGSGLGPAAIQFVGDCGRGKTTRLLAIRHHVAPAGAYLCLPPWAACGPSWWGRVLRMRDRPLMIDEAQRIPWPIRTSLFRRRMPLVLGTHRDFGRELRRAGYRVTTVAIGPQNDARHVRRVANRRLAAAALHPGEVPRLTLADAESLVSRFGDDLRAIESYLYLQVQQQVGRDEQMRFID